MLRSHIEGRLHEVERESKHAGHYRHVSAFLQLQIHDFGREHVETFFHKRSSRRHFEFRVAQIEYRATRTVRADNLRFVGLCNEDDGSRSSQRTLAAVAWAGMGLSRHPTHEASEVHVEVEEPS